LFLLLAKPDTATPSHPHKKKLPMFSTRPLWIVFIAIQPPNGQVLWITLGFLVLAAILWFGFENRRAWEALRFPVHPKHDDARSAHDVDVLFTVILPGP